MYSICTVQSNYNFTLSCVSTCGYTEELLCLTLYACMSHVHIQHVRKSPCVVINSARLKYKIVATSQVV